MLIHRIVLMEPDKVARETWHDQLSKEQFQVTTAPVAPESLQDMAKKGADLLITSVDCLQGPIGQAADEMLKASSSPLLLVVAEADRIAAAVEWLGRGAFDYLLKPFDWPQLQGALTKADRHIRCALASRAQVRSSLESAVLHGTSPAVAQLRQIVRKLARTEATVLIQGEPGSGHENIAAALHEQSSRAAGPLLRVDCADAGASDLRDDLFGSKTRVSRILIASGGTVVIEEVARLDLSLQEKLLRFCQSSVVDCGGRAAPADVRIIATSSTPLEPKMKAGAFREDLFFRLDIARLDLPPLRERVPDISEIAGLLREYYAQKYDLAALAFSPEAQLALTQHLWPGNLRELEQVIDRAILRCGTGAIILPEHLGLTIASAAAPRPPIDSLAEVEKQQILAVLERCDGNRTHAAARLGISIRTLRNKLREFRLAAAAA